MDAQIAQRWQVACDALLERHPLGLSLLVDLFTMLGKPEKGSRSWTGRYFTNCYARCGSGVESRSWSGSGTDGWNKVGFLISRTGYANV